MKAFFKSKQWRIIVTAMAILPALLLLGILLIPLRFVNDWPGRIMILLWLGLAFYALALNLYGGRLRKGLCMAGIVVLGFVSLQAVPMILFTRRRAVEYIASPNGVNTAVVVRHSFTSTACHVYPLRAKIFIRSEERVFLGEGFEPPDTSQFIWVDENILQFEDENGETRTVEF